MELDVALSVAFVVALGVRAAAALAERRRAGASVLPAAEHARRGAALAAAAQAHHRAWAQSELGVDRRRAVELAQEAVAHLDEACDRAPDRARHPGWQRERALARALLRAHSSSSSSAASGSTASGSSP